MRFSHVIGQVIGAAAVVSALISGLAPAGAQQLTSTLGGDIDPWLWGDTAMLRGLDKVTAETRDFEAPIGEDVRFFALTINVKHCAKRPPEETPETIIGMEIFDRQTDGSGIEIEPKRIFSGWMFASSPALNPLEHPVYDVWSIGCTGQAEGPRTPGELSDEGAASTEFELELRPEFGPELGVETGPLPGEGAQTPFNEVEAPTD